MRKGTQLRFKLVSQKDKVHKPIFVCTCSGYQRHTVDALICLHSTDTFFEFTHLLMQNVINVDTLNIRLCLAKQNNTGDCYKPEPGPHFATHFLCRAIKFNKIISRIISMLV